MNSRPTAQEALGNISVLLCAMTGADHSEFMTHTRHAVVDTARNIALNFMHERLGYNFTETARAFPIDEVAESKRAAEGKRRRKHGRHRTAVTHAHERGWELIDGAGEAGLSLRDWIESTWQDPIELHRDKLEAMR